MASELNKDENWVKNQIEHFKKVAANYYFE
jgi:hypothetical protein